MVGYVLVWRGVGWRGDSGGRVHAGIMALGPPVIGMTVGIFRAGVLSVSGVWCLGPDKHTVAHLCCLLFPPYLSDEIT